MEAIPRLPMLYFELKISPSDPDFEGPFKKFIGKYYHEDPESYSREIRELDALRRNATRAPRDVTGCALLKRYYSQIYSLENRFQIHSAIVDIQFAWLNVYTEETVCGDMHFELASVLYNIGALHAELGALDLRNTDKSMKIACTHFQCAAWAFEQIRDNPKGNKSKDLSHDLLSFLVHVMMAQAQECILEKSMLDNKKSSITSKVAAQACEYYNSALLVLLQAAMNTSYGSIIDIVGSKLYKEWKKFIELKISYYNSICCLFMGMFCEEQKKMGERITWFRTADEKLKESLKLAKNLDKPETIEAIAFLNDYIAGKLNNAQKENDIVFHEVVPTSDKLTAVKGVSLVKGIPFVVSDPDVCGVDIFRRLVPIECHETASIYSENKDQIMRVTRSKIDTKNQELEAYLNSVQLSTHTIRPKVADVPDELIEICAAMSVNSDAIEKVLKSLKKLDSLTAETESILKQARQCLDKEQAKDKEHQSLYGVKRPSSTTSVMTDLDNELKKHEEAHAKACQSSSQVKENFERHLGDIRVISDSSGKSLNNVLPSVIDVPVAAGNLEELEKLMKKVDEMKAQRFQLENQLREAVQKDDVLAKVLSHSKEDIDEIFGKELKKFEKFTSLIDQNLAAQENILSALTKTNAKYAQTRKALVEQEKVRQERVQELIIAYEVFQSVLTNTDKGIEFYAKFKDIITRTQARVKSVVSVQEDQRAQLISKHVKMTPKQPGAFGMANISGALPAAIPQPGEGGLKLKDYLPYMNNGRNHQPFPQQQQSLPPATYSAAVVNPNHNMSMGSPYMPQNQPAVPVSGAYSNNTMPHHQPTTTHYSSNVQQYHPGAPMNNSQTGGYVQQPQYIPAYNSPQQYPTNQIHQYPANPIQQQYTVNSYADGYMQQSQYGQPQYTTPGPAQYSVAAQAPQNFYQPSPATAPPPPPKSNVSLLDSLDDSGSNSYESRPVLQPTLAPSL